MVWILNAFENICSFFNQPSRFKTQLMVLSGGKQKPEFVNLHLLADAPI
jgi:hypothetical protein